MTGVQTCALPISSLFICQVPRKLFKLFLSSLLGTIVSLVSPLIHIPNIIFIFLKILLAICMILIASEYKTIRKFILCLNVFILLTFLIGGAIIAILYALNKNFILENGIIVNQGFSVSLIVCFALVLTDITLKIVKILYKKKTLTNFLQKCQIVIKGKSFALMGLIDTGNRLYDDKNGCPIIVISKTLAEKFNITSYLIKPLYNIKFTTVAGQNIMPVYKLNGVMLYNDNKLTYKSASLAISSIEYDKEYDIILHPALL